MCKDEHPLLVKISFWYLKRNLATKWYPSENPTPILGETRTALTGIFWKFPYKNLTFEQPFCGIPRKFPYKYFASEEDAGTQ